MKLPRKTTALAILLAAPIALAQGDAAATQDAADAPVTMPDTPAGDAAQQFIDFFNDRVVPVIREPATPIMGPHLDTDPLPGDPRLSAQAEQRFPIEKVAEYMDDRQESFGRFKLVGIKSVADDHVGVLVQAQGDGSGWFLEVWTEPEWPHRINQWQFIPSAEAARVPELNSWADIASALDNYAKTNELKYSLCIAELPANAAGPDNAITLTRAGVDERLNMGAMIRYFLLDALVAKVNEGAFDWKTDTTTVSPTAHSLPPSRVSQVPPDTEVPTLALVEQAMLNRDNTAFDALVELVGRDAVLDSLSTRTGDEPRNTPFLDTMDLFKLKIGAQGEVAESYIAADEASQAEMLGSEVALNEVPEAFLQTWRLPQHVSTVGWFATAEDLTKLLADLWSMQGAENAEPVTAVLFYQAQIPSQGPEWETTAFRVAPFEPGVVPAYWLLRRDDQRSFIIALIINNETAHVPFEPLQPILIATVDYLANLDRAAPPKPEPSSDDFNNDNNAGSTPE